MGEPSATSRRNIKGNRHRLVLAEEFRSLRLEWRDEKSRHRGRSIDDGSAIVSRSRAHRLGVGIQQRSIPHRRSRRHSVVGCRAWNKWARADYSVSRRRTRRCNSRHCSVGECVLAGVHTGQIDDVPSNAAAFKLLVWLLVRLQVSQWIYSLFFA